jgi:hypothetical protein
MKFIKDFKQTSDKEHNQIFGKFACGIFLILIAFTFTTDQTFAQTESGSSSLIVAQGVSADGSVHVTITSSSLELHKPLALYVSFMDSNGNKILHENYGILVMQQEGNGFALLSNSTAHATNGDDLQVTLPLDNTSPVVFQVQLQGAGLLGTDSSTWKGPQGDTVTISIVPEFGSIVPVIFILSFIAAILIMQKSGIRFLQFDNHMVR